MEDVMTALKATYLDCAETMRSDIKNIHNYSIRIENVDLERITETGHVDELVTALMFLRGSTTSAIDNLALMRRLGKFLDSCQRNKWGSMMPGIGKEMMRFEFLTQISNERLDNFKIIIGNLNNLGNNEKDIIKNELTRLQHQLSDINDRLSYILTSNTGDGKKTASGVHSSLLADMEQGIHRIVVHRHK
jgi:hypothetical protein